MASSTAFQNSAYLRVASLAVGLYELICTLPAEYRFYRQQYVRRSLSQQCTLFILIRYVSVAVVLCSNIGFFGNFFTLEACRHFMLISPILKALQLFVSQLILSTRTYTISRRSRWVFWVMLVTLGVSVPVEFFTNVYQRTPVQSGPKAHNCTSGNASSQRIAWVHYLVGMIFDMIAICISSGYLWAYRSAAARVSHFVQTLLYEGLGYIVALTAINIFNLILYIHASESAQSSAATLGYVITFIMSQRILIRQREYASKYAESEDGSYEVSISRPLDTTREINAALRSQFECETYKSGAVISTPYEGTYTLSAITDSSTSSHQVQLQSLHFSQTRSQRRPEAEDIEAQTESGLDVQVRIERNVVVERTRTGLSRENYKKPRVMWER